MSLVEWIRERSRLVAGAVGLTIAAAEYGYIPYPWDMEGSGVVATAAIVVAVAGYVGGGYVADLLPDEEGIYLIAFEASDEAGGSIWELSEDQFADMDVHAGTLFEWPVSKRVYEVKEYRPDDNVAVANWRESVAGSQLAGDCKVIDALEQIGELRDEFEPEAQKSRYLQRRIRSIVRRQDRERLRDQQDVLDPTIAPTFDESRKTVSEIVDEEIPDELKPDTMTDGEHLEEEAETIGFDLLDETEALEQNGANP